MAHKSFLIPDDLELRLRRHLMAQDKDGILQYGEMTIFMTDAIREKLIRDEKRGDDGGS